MLLLRLGNVCVLRLYFVEMIFVSGGLFFVVVGFLGRDGESGFIFKGWVLGFFEGV